MDRRLIFLDADKTNSTGAYGGPRRSLRRGPPSRVGGELAIASSAQPRRENHAAEFSQLASEHRSRLSRFPDFPGVQ